MISSRMMIVDEVFSVTQGYQTEGQRVTVRGSLNATNVGSYALFNSEWDPFDPEAGKDIPRLELLFRKNQEADDRLGWYADVTGTIATEPKNGGGVSVILVDAVIEPILEGQRTEMKLRKPNDAHQDGGGQPATQSESK